MPIWRTSRPRTGRCTRGCSLDEDEARRQADEADSRLASHGREGAAALDALPGLLGIPVALKDLFSRRGQPSTAGSRILQG